MAKQEKSAAELYREERKARLAKAAKKNAKQRHKIIWNKKNKSIVSVIVVIALVMGIAGIVLSSLGMFERGKKMMTVGGAEVDKYEMVYYSTRAYQNLFESAMQYESYGEGYGVMFTGLDWQTQPDKQPYAGTVEGIENPTVADYIIDQAKTELQRVKAYVKYAEDNGITLDATEKAEVQSAINSMKTTAENSGYGYANYLRSEYGYGKGMTPALYEKILTEITIAQKVSELKNEEFSAVYTDEKIEEIYLEKITDYGVVSYRVYAVEAIGKDEKRSATDEEMASAKEKADALAALTEEEAFLQAAADIEKEKENKDYEKYLTDDTLTLKEDVDYTTIDAENNGDFADWIFHESRKTGETYVAEKAGVGYTVYMISEPVHKIDSEYTYDVRHILIKFPEEEKSEEATEETDEEATENSTDETAEEIVAELLDTGAYEAVIDIDVDLETAKDPALYMAAQDILKEYLDGKMTEESFGELAKEHSADGNASQGGIYEDVPQGQMVAEFENWALEEGRKAGDVGIVETQFGYHIMYFIAKEEVTSWATVIKDASVAEDFDAFDADTLAANPVADYKAKYVKDVKEFLKTVARTTINNYASAGYSYY